MVLPGRAYVHEYVRGNLSNLWLTIIGEERNFKRKEVNLFESIFIHKIVLNIIIYI